MIEILKNIETDELIEILRKNNPGVKDIDILDLGYFFHLLKSGEVEKAMSFVQEEKKQVPKNLALSSSDEDYILNNPLKF